MQTNRKHTFAGWLAAARAAATLALIILSSPCDGAVFQPLYAFSGQGPVSRLILASDGNLYGTMEMGGAFGFGSVFRLSSNGVLTTVYSFTGGSDGFLPVAGLIQASDGSLYGTTAYGDDGSPGTVFRVTTNGTFKTLHSFTGGRDGGLLVYRGGLAAARASLMQASDGNIYGTTSWGGAYGTADGGYGTVFRITPSGVLTTLHSFSVADNCSQPTVGLVQAADGNLYGTTPSAVYRITLSGQLTVLYNLNIYTDGWEPNELVLGSDGYLYGTTQDTTQDWKPGAYGTIFQVDTNGVFNTLYYFTGGDDGGGSDGALVQASDGNFYGTATYGTGNQGTVFQVIPSGSFTVLHTFTGGSDGGNPVAALAQASDGTLYGTTAIWGRTEWPTNCNIFNITTDGTFGVVCSFTENGGAVPLTGLMQASDGNLYGTTSQGGSNNLGTVFRMTTEGVLTPIYSFAGGADGAYPQGPALVEVGQGALYGTVGSNVFRISTQGDFTTVYSFSGGGDGNGATALTRGADGNLYGTAAGGISNAGTILRLTPGGALQTLYSFTGGTDGASPTALTVANDGDFYGAAFSGGSSNLGTIFRLSTNGAFTMLYSFTGQNNDADPIGLVQGSDGKLYGNTATTIFRITTNGVYSHLYTFPSGFGNGRGQLVPASDGQLYWAATDWPAANNATSIFSVSTNGIVTIVCSYTNYLGTGGGSAFGLGILPAGALTQASDGNLYGTLNDPWVEFGGGVFRVVLAGRTVRPVTIPTPQVSGGQFLFQVPTSAGQSYTVQQSSDLASTNWAPYTNFIGDGSTFQFAVPIGGGAKSFFRVREP